MGKKTDEDEAVCERIAAAEEKMQSRMLDWAAMNTGSWNADGLKALAPKLADAFSALDADVF